jgi:hypothetical protein
MSANPASPPPLARLTRRWMLLAAQAAFAAFAAAVVGVVAVKSRALPDFSMFWAAHHVARPYDPAVLSKSLGPRGAFFPYAPTFLLLTAPLAWVSLPAGYLGWIVLSATALVASVRRLGAAVVLAAPAVFMAGMIGQTSLIMGALLFAGATLPKRPILAGALFGVAACIKPQAVVLVPLMLLAAGRWRTLAGAAATGLLLCVAATLVYGPDVWSHWLRSLPSFLQINDTRFAGRYLALPGFWKVAALLVGAVASWLAGRSGQVERGVFIAIAMALLGSLHAMDYDAAILAPFAVSAALCLRWPAFAYAATLVLPPSTWTVLAMGTLATLDLYWGSRLRIPLAWPGSKQNGNML